MQDHQPSVDWTIGRSETTWTPYPLLHPPLDVLRAEYFEIDARLYIYTNEAINNMYLEQRGTNSWPALWLKAINIHERLSQWWKQIQPMVRLLSSSPYHLYALKFVYTLMASLCSANHGIAYDSTGWY